VDGRLWINHEKYIKNGKVLTNLVYFSYDINRDPHSKKISNIKFDIWHPAVGLRCRNPPRHFSFQSKVLFWLLSDWSAWVGFCTSSPQQGVKYQLWYLNFLLWRGSLWISHENYIKESKVYCGLEVQKPTQALQSVKGQDNTLDWHPKWTRTLPSLIYFSYDINRDPHSKKISNIKFDIWHPAVGILFV
jgi:hypothetical protein